MSWYAADALDEAYDRTKALLTPFDAGTWLRIAVIAVLAGGVGSGFNVPGAPSGSGPSTQDPGLNEPSSTGGIVDGISEFAQPVLQDGTTETVTGAITATPRTGLAVGLIVAVVALIIGLVVVSATFEFIFFRVLLDGNVRIRRHFRPFLGAGARLAGFRIGAILLALLALAPVIGAVAIDPLMAIPVGLLWIVGLFAVLILLSLTDSFIPLAMMETDRGVIATWKHIYPALHAQWKQVGIFLLLKFVVGISTGIISIIALLLLLLPLAVIVGIVYLVASAPLIAGATAVLLGVAALGAFFVFVNGPVQTYLQYYNISVYEKLSPVQQ